MHRVADVDVDEGQVLPGVHEQLFANDVVQCLGVRRRLGVGSIMVHGVIDWDLTRA